MELPIDEVRGQFVDALESGAPVVVTAPTGSGKSTRLPLWLGFPRDAAPPRRVLVVEPRRVACRALALFLARQRGEAVGGPIGYRVRFDDRSGPETRVLFATPGVALNLFAAGAAQEFDAILVDEFHERGWEVDLVVALTRLTRSRSGGGPRLVLCSATLELDALVERLDARLIRARGRRFPVEIEHAGDEAPSAAELELRVAAALRRLLGAQESAGAPGDILVFLPGKREIERCRQAAAELPLTPVVVHGGVSPERLVDAFAPREPGARPRVYLATNVAETSVTLPGVTAVVDSGLARMRLHRAGRSVLALAPISRASMEQRAGRAGRVAPGRCVRLWTRSFTPRESTPPELERVELDDMVLRASLCGLAAGELADAPWVTPPPGFALESAITRLRGLSALDDDARLSDYGRQLARLPVNASAARLLVDPPPALQGLLVELVALLELGRALVLPGQQPEAVAVAREQLFGALEDEVCVELTALRRGDPTRHGLHRGALQAARALATSLARRLELTRPRFGSSREDPLPPRAELARFLLGRLPEAAFVLRPRAAKPTRARDRARGQPWSNGVCELTLWPYRVPGRDPAKPPPAPRCGLVLDSAWIGVGRGARGHGSLLLPCAPRQLYDAGLGTDSLQTPRLEREGGARTIVGELAREYAGVVLHRETRALSGAPLREAASALIQRGTLLRGLADSLRDDLHAWALLASLPRDDAAGRRLGRRAPPGAATRPREPIDPPPELEALLAARLEEIGLAEPSDLELLEPEDLRPDLAPLARAAGLEREGLDALTREFPRLWTDDGARYRCRVDMRRRRVVLEPANKSARARGEPSARRLPRFRGFRVEFHKASRRVTLR